jgi:hypothetical protein
VSEDYFQALEEGIDIIIDVFHDNSNRYMVVSKSKQFAIQLKWESDTRSKTDTHQGFTATTLDYASQKKMLHGDLKIFVEQMQKDHLHLWFEGQEASTFIYGVGYYSLKVPECDNYVVYIKEGEFGRNFVFVEVE